MDEQNWKAQMDAAPPAATQMGPSAVPGVFGAPHYVYFNI